MLRVIIGLVITMFAAGAEPEAPVSAILLTAFVGLSCMWWGVRDINRLDKSLD